MNKGGFLTDPRHLTTSAGKKLPYIAPLLTNLSEPAINTKPHLCIEQPSSDLMS